jgi:uncharacterized protein YjbJ (UPF0337 family)
VRRVENGILKLINKTTQPHETSAWRFDSVKGRNTAMSGKTDQIKGRIKEAAGVLTDNDSLKREGKLDQVVGKVKEKTEEAVDRIKNVLINNRLNRQAK